MSRRPLGPQAPPTSPLAHGRRLSIGLGLWLALYAVVQWSTDPPRPRPEDAPEHEFSATRAAQVLDRLADGLGPHPSGSEAAHELLGRIEGELAALGWGPQRQVALGLGPDRTLGRMHNLVARRAGEGDAPAVLVVSHYDSVGAGPGIGDDLAGVAAVLEVARALGDAEPERTVLLLFTDGEEAGLVGAEAFLHAHPWAQEVGVVLNLEARGTSGPSHMFQTGPDNAWLLDVLAGAARRPDANSVSAEIYRRMPNDTDFSLFLERDLAGLNFAFIGDWYAYHTPLDDRAHLSLASLQHQGEQVLAVLRGLEALESSDTPPGDAVYATLFGRVLARTSIGFTRLLALVGALGLLWALQRAVAHRQLTWGRATLGLAWVPLCVLVPVALAQAYGLGLRALTGTASPWHAHPAPGWIALLGGLLLCTSLLGAWGKRLATPLGLALGVWTWWGLAGLFSAVFVPGASFLLAWPALWMALIANAVRLREVEARAARAALFTVALTVPLWAPVQGGLAAAFGLEKPALTLGVFALQATLLLPLLGAAPALARRGCAGLGGACLLLGAVLTVVLPHQSAERPGRLNLVYAADDEQDLWQAWTFGAPLPAELAGALDWRRERGSVTWVGHEGWSAPAPRLALPLPVFEEVERELHDDGRLTLRGTVRSYAFAARTSLQVLGEREVLALRVEGRDLGRAGSVHLIAPGQEGYRVELELAAGGEARLRLIDRVHGLPAEGAPLDDARGPTFVPSHDGDGMLLVSLVPLGDAR